MQTISVMLKEYGARNGSYPENVVWKQSLVQLTGAEQQEDMFFDAWGREIRYSRSEDGRSFTLSSLGKDGEPGGTDENRDLELEAQLN
jgi:hypothetical protein